jgi:5-methylthioadenosine/S-adenosylhomocysteine deaminase
MFSELQYAALLAKVESGDAAAVNAMTALEMATLNGARAMGLEDQIGSLEIGKQADICAIDLRDAKFQPLYNSISQIVYSNSGDHVKNVWVAGECVLENRRVKNLSEENVLTRVKAWQDKMQPQTEKAQ